MNTLTKKYSCAVCDEICAEVHLYPNTDSKVPFGLTIDKFIGTVSFYIEKEDFDKLISLYDNDQLKTIFKEDDLWVPFYCYECDKTYCKNHWDSWVEFDDGFYDAEIGKCPHGHKRVLND